MDLEPIGDQPPERRGDDLEQARQRDQQPDLGEIEPGRAVVQADVWYVESQRREPAEVEQSWREQSFVHGNRLSFVSGGSSHSLHLGGHPDNWLISAVT